MDLSIEKNMYKLHDLTKGKNIDILINNAGFGLFGYFTETNLDTELKMIDLNIKCVHILTKLFLPDFVKKNSGYISSDELGIREENSDIILPCGIYARWEKEKYD
jgi:short-subunit dehydrogenase